MDNSSVECAKVSGRKVNTWAELAEQDATSTTVTTTE